MLLHVQVLGLTCASVVSMHFLQQLMSQVVCSWFLCSSRLLHVACFSAACILILAFMMAQRGPNFFVLFCVW